MTRSNKAQKKKEIAKPERSTSALRQITHSEDFEERRKTARLDIPIKVQYRIIGKQEHIKGAVTKDVSVGGCLLIAAEDIPLNSELELEIFLGVSDEESLKIKGRIARLDRKEHELYEFGIFFDSLSKDARRLFADYFFSKMYEMIGLSEWPTDRRAK